MKYLDYENAMLERFRAKHRDLVAADTPANLYALVDPVALRWYEVPDRSRWLTPLQRMPLYAGSGLEGLEATGPVLLAMPDLRSTGTLTVSSFSAHAPTAADAFVNLLGRSTRNTSHVTWIWSPHQMAALVEHLQTLLHARLGPDDRDVWFFFYQPSHLRVLHERLPEATRRYMFGPIHAWWMLDRHHSLVELTGDSLPIPTPWEALPVPADVVAALQRAAMPQQVHAWLRKTRLTLTGTPFHNEQLAEIEPLVDRALNYRLAGKQDLQTFVVYGLRFKVDYDKHPRLQAPLTDAVARSQPLVKAYRDVHHEVWSQLAATAQQRVEASEICARQAEMKKAGHVRLRARIVNDTGGTIYGLVIDLPMHAQRQFLGSIEGSPYRESTLDKDAVLSPLPGDKLILRWDESTAYGSGRSMCTPHRRELVVKGELPNDEKSGVLEIYFGKFGQAVVMHKGKDDLNHAKKGEA